MSKLIDWYVVELRLRLEGKLPSDRIDTIVREAESHLAESIQRQVALNVELETAERAAIQAYGRPEKVAVAHLRRSPHRMWGMNPAWVAMFGALIAILSWNFHWLTLDRYFDNFGEAWQNELAGVIGLGGLALIVMAAQSAYRSNRIFVAGFTILAALATIPIMSYWMIGEATPPFSQGISRFHLARDVPNIERTVAKLDLNEAFVERGIAAYQRSASVASLPDELTLADVAAKELGETEFTPAVLGTRMDRGGNFVVPRRYGAFAEVDGRVWVLSTMAHYADARTEWQVEGPKVLRELGVQRNAMASLLVSARQAKGGRLFFPNPDLYLETVIATLFLLPGFLILDWVGALLPRAKRRWPGRALA